MVIPCDKGPYPPLALGSLFFDFLLKPRAIVLCDSELLLVERNSANELQPKSIVYRGSPEDLRLQRVGWLYARVALGQELLWIERKYFQDMYAVVRQSDGG